MGSLTLISADVYEMDFYILILFLTLFLYFMALYSDFLSSFIQPFFLQHELFCVITWDSNKQHNPKLFAPSFVSIV